MPQYFKGDAEELKYYNSGNPTVTLLNSQKQDFFNEIYNCFVLGEVLYDSGRAPLTNAIPRAIFRESFATIFDAFVAAGTFESYLEVFQNIFGEDVVVEFTVPAPGKLLIDVEATGTAIYDFITRYIVDGAYVYDNIIDDEGDQIVFQSVKGFESQYELETMLFQMVPGGIYTEITLTVGA